MNHADIFQTANNWKYLLICPSAGLTKELNQLIGGQMPKAEVLEIPVYPPSAGLMEVLSVQLPDILFADVISDPDRGLGLIREVNSMQPKLPVVAVIQNNDTDLILRCLRAGSSEFLSHPFSVEQLQETLNRVMSKNPGMKGSGKVGRIVSIIPAKGACGASTIASGVAFHWKKKSGKLLLADLDPLTGTLSFLLKLRSQFNFMDAVSRQQGLDENVWKSLISTTTGIDVLLAPEGTVEGLHDLTSAGNILDFARFHYETTLIDTAGIYGSWNLSIARHSDDILLVSTNELPSLQATQRALNYLDQNRVDRGKVKLLVNRYNRDVGLSKEVIETALRCEVFQLLPSDFDGVQRAMIDGKPVPVNTPFGKALQQLAQKLSGPTPGSGAPVVKKSSWGGLINLFSRTSS
jgi:pilus assembly protein CpaE